MTAENRYASGCAWIEGQYVPIAEGEDPHPRYGIHAVRPELRRGCGMEGPVLPSR